LAFPTRIFISEEQSDERNFEFFSRCTFCSSPVDEDESAGPKSDSRLLLAKFNTQMEKLYDLLHAVENIRLVFNG
jgi:hypothetical protein